MMTEERSCETCRWEAREPEDQYPCNLCANYALWIEAPKVSKDAETGVDPVNHPAHYTQGGVECIDAIAAAVTGLAGMEAVCTAQVIKYVWRWKHKNGLEDLQKADFYLNWLMRKGFEK